MGVLFEDDTEQLWLLGPRRRHRVDHRAHADRCRAEIRPTRSPSTAVPGADTTNTADDASNADQASDPAYVLAT